MTQSTSPITASRSASATRSSTAPPPWARRAGEPGAGGGRGGRGQGAGGGGGRGAGGAARGLPRLTLTIPPARCLPPPQRQPRAHSLLGLRRLGQVQARRVLPRQLVGLSGGAAGGAHGGSGGGPSGDQDGQHQRCGGAAWPFIHPATPLLLSNHPRAENQRPDYFCSRYEWDSPCQPFTKETIARFAKGFKACLQKVGGHLRRHGLLTRASWRRRPPPSTVPQGPEPAPTPCSHPSHQAHDLFDEVLISPHVDDATKTGHWRNTLLFDPLEKDK
jgi:hypothetical protein